MLAPQTMELSSRIFQFQADKQEREGDKKNTKKNKKRHPIQSEIEFIDFFRSSSVYYLYTHKNCNVN